MSTPKSLQSSVAWLLLAALVAGCGGTPRPESQAARDKPPRSHRQTAQTGENTKKNTKATKSPKASQDTKKGPSGMFREPGAATPEPAAKAAEGPAGPRPKPRQRTSLADLLSGNPAAMTDVPEDLADPPDAVGRMVPNLPRMEIDESKVRAAGIRRLEGKHLTLYTDLPPGAEVDGLPGVFDLAFPQWCDYLVVEPSEHADWRLTGVLMKTMKDKARFEQAGLMPADLPAFPHGYARNFEFWLYEQPSDYYRRHLLLHEGTHGFMNTLLGSCGPPWYMEGIAELLGTHLWKDGRLTLGYFPATRDEVPMWGRIKIVRDAYDRFAGARLDDIVHYSGSAHRSNDPYGWCWAAAAFLDRHPRYQQRFRQLPQHVAQRGFSNRFLRMMADDWDQLCEEWELYVARLEYGYDIPREAIDFRPGQPLAEGGATVSVAADRGWQSSGVRLEKGKSYRLSASGRYQVADRPKPWPCEPGGVSIRYWEGRPLGILLGAVRPDEYRVDRPSPLLRPIVIGLGTTLVPQESGTLYLRINDSPGELADNAGTLSVRVEPESP